MPFESHLLICEMCSLINAIQASHGLSAEVITGRSEVNTVKETATYCDAKPGHNIMYIATICGVRIYLDRTAAEKYEHAPSFLSTRVVSVTAFAILLMDCADIFGLDRASIHIFSDDAGSTIAFNHNGSLFFNLRYFENLHLHLVKQKVRSEAITYWAVVMAHELAHNLVRDHSAQHSYYTESMVIQYFGKIAAKVAWQPPTNRSMFDPFPQVPTYGVPPPPGPMNAPNPPAPRRNNPFVIQARPFDGSYD